MATKKIQILGSLVELDSTLTQENKAADAKATGDAITSVENSVQVLSDLVGETPVSEQIEAAISESVSSSHDHNNLYYTEAEVDEKVEMLNSAISNRAESQHSHDDKYYTEAEVDGKVDEVSSAVADLSDTVSTNYDKSIVDLSIDKTIITCVKGDGSEYALETQDTTYSAGTGISLSGTTFSNSGVRSITTGFANGTISVNTNGDPADIAVKGLGSAAYTEATAYDVAGTAQTKAAEALGSAKTYTDTKVAELVNSAPETMNTFRKVADAIVAHQDVTDDLNDTIASHISNKSNPHSVTPAQIGAVAKSGDTMTGGLTATGLAVLAEHKYPSTTLKTTIDDRAISYGAAMAENTMYGQVVYNDGKGNAEYYMFPDRTSEETGNAWHNILTSKNPVTISQGGTGATTATGACDSIGAVKKSGDTMTGKLRMLGAGAEIINSSWPVYGFASDATGAVVGTGGMFQSQSSRRIGLQEIADGSTQSENYLLPTPNKQDSAKWYDILTTKNPVSIAQGGTGLTKAGEVQSLFMNSFKVTRDDIKIEETDVLSLPTGIYHHEGTTSTANNYPIAATRAMIEVIGQQREGTAANDGYPNGYWAVRVTYPYSGEQYWNHRTWSAWTGWRKTYITSNDSLQVGTTKARHLNLWAGDDGHTKIGHQDASWSETNAIYMYDTHTYFKKPITVLTEQYWIDSKYGVDMANSDIINANGIYFTDDSNAAGEGINFYRSSTTWDTLVASGGKLYFAPNRATSEVGTRYEVYHSGGSVVPVSKGGTGLSQLTAGEVVVGNGTSVPTSRAIVHNTNVGSLGWSNNSNALTTLSTLAYWDGAYSGTSSNIRHLNTVVSGTWNATAIGVAYGGTGATNAAGARANLGAITMPEAYIASFGNNIDTDILSMDVSYGIHWFEGNARKAKNWPEDRDAARYMVTVKGLIFSGTNGYRVVEIENLNTHKKWVNRYHWSGWSGWQEVVDSRGGTINNGKLRVDADTYHAIEINNSNYANSGHQEASLGFLQDGNLKWNMGVAVGAAKTEDFGIWDSTSSSLAFKIQPNNGHMCIYRHFNSNTSGNFGNSLQVGSNAKRQVLLYSGDDHAKISNQDASWLEYNAMYMYDNKTWFKKEVEVNGNIVAKNGCLAVAADGWAEIQFVTADRTTSHAAIGTSTNTNRLVFMQKKVNAEGREHYYLNEPSSTAGDSHYNIYTTKNLVYSSTQPTGAQGMIWLKPIS